MLNKYCVSWKSTWVPHNNNHHHHVVLQTAPEEPRPELVTTSLPNLKEVVWTSLFSSWGSSTSWSLRWAWERRRRTCWWSGSTIQVCSSVFWHFYFNKLTTGKSTLLNHFKPEQEQNANIVPTVGFNVEKFKSKVQLSSVLHQCSLEIKSFAPAHSLLWLCGLMTSRAKLMWW